MYFGYLLSMEYGFEWDGVCDGSNLLRVSLVVSMIFRCFKGILRMKLSRR